MQQRILLIDDEVQIRRFMRISLQAEGFAYLEASNARQGIDMIALESPDLVILDLGLPDEDGFKVLQTLRSWSNLPVLVLTARDAEEEKVKLLEGGANDYLSKPFGIRELIARVRVLLRDLKESSNEETTPARLVFNDLEIDIPNHQVWHKAQLLTLSRKEFALLVMLARHPGRLITQQQLLTSIWGKSHVEDTHYLRIFVSQLRKKLQDNADDPTYILTEPGIGYRFIPLPLC
ncbi:two-component system, OmpR family, KDP operon response regulator KdpE [Thiothrix caldifontis]|uniref:Two-component system, OmpR family, KDP operon response regulator KdpE n=1 Tax=Thiothrix caldifontis TaxID=525918 RepID=A0A1H4GGI0_9GAMM|nr:response regulator transcription factor [Thiothrix caldifontis]SEB08371.1 two-component system, OmpR family, KDP operon response regulator KdpE [Thiothrix caldifontis]